MRLVVADTQEHVSRAMVLEYSCWDRGPDARLRSWTYPGPRDGHLVRCSYAGSGVLGMTLRLLP